MAASAAYCEQCGRRIDDQRLGAFWKRICGDSRVPELLLTAYHRDRDLVGDVFNRLGRVRNMPDHLLTGARAHYMMHNAHVVRRRRLSWDLPWPIQSLPAVAASSRYPSSFRRGQIGLNVVCLPP